MNSYSENDLDPKVSRSEAKLIHPRYYDYIPRARRRMAYEYFKKRMEELIWTLWFHSIPALGLPGASHIKKIQKEHVEGLQEIWVFIEQKNDQPDR